MKRGDALGRGVAWLVGAKTIKVTLTYKGIYEVTIHCTVDIGETQLRWFFLDSSAASVVEVNIH